MMNAQLLVGDLLRGLRVASQPAVQEDRSVGTERGWGGAASVRVPQEINEDEMEGGRKKNRTLHPR